MSRHQDEQAPRPIGGNFATCGCVPIDVTYCDLHEAAPALYEALKVLLDTETNLNGVSGMALLDAVDKARDALKLAQGSKYPKGTPTPEKA